MRNHLATFLATMAIVSAGGSATRAVDLTFDFSSLPSDQTSYSVVSGAYTLHLLNPVGSSINSSKFFVDEDGIYLGSAFAANPGFSMQIVGGPLDFKNYEIGYINSGATGTFALSGGTGTSTGNALNPVGTYAFNGSYSIAPGNTVVLTSTFTTGGLK